MRDATCVNDIGLATVMLKPSSSTIATSTPTTLSPRVFALTERYLRGRVSTLTYLPI
jgi:hypothetical protein